MDCGACAAVLHRVAVLGLIDPSLPAGMGLAGQLAATRSRRTIRERKIERMTTIQSNGSKWAGEEPDTVETLLEVLASHPLDRRFEACGNFIQKNPRLANGTGRVSENPETRIFWGNFFTVSHVFHIETTDRGLITRLTLAIRENQTRDDYLIQDKPIRSNVGRKAVAA